MAEQEQSSLELIAEYEEAFAKRYTEEDEEYTKTVEKTASPPPCISDWLNVGYSRNQGRDDRRDRSQGQNRYADRYHPYQRSDDRYGGGRHGDRYERYGNRQDDRSRHPNRDTRRKPATEYGSDGYYQYYY